jgi:crossover junction endodeoxyribonuclease RusA
MTEILITMPIPDRVLSPNSRAHWATRAKAVKAQRQLAYLLTRSAGGAGLKWPQCVAKVDFYWPCRRDRDIDNANATLKAAFDGMREAGLFVDDNSSVLSHEPTEFHIDAENPRVEIRVRKA